VPETKKTLEPLVKSIQKDQAEKDKKSTHVSESLFSPVNFPDILLPGNKIVAPDPIIK